jgi:Ni,Fe-hydrogenase III small subunit/formate hydrogenlyase subunit 6/NADH:ubiquinone oxidoreductase subunit I
MFDVLMARWRQGHRTMRYPAGPPPELPERFAGLPQIDAAMCRKDCRECLAVCPTAAIRRVTDATCVQLDLGRCLFCRQCESACGNGAIAFSREHRMAATCRKRLVIGSPAGTTPSASREPSAEDAALRDRAAAIRHLFGRSLKLRQVSAGGCNACEADTNVLATVAWDLNRFGIQFVASPRHADGLLITGPVTENMRLALQKTYEAVPQPKLVIAVGACAISGGPYAAHSEVHDGAASLLPVDLLIPGCPPHPLTILDGLLSLLGRVVR